MATAKTTEVTLDAGGKVLGRIASEAASYLRGKRDPLHEPHLMPTCKVIIKNAGSVYVTGRKMTQEGRERYSGFHSGLRKPTYGDVFKKDPRKFVFDAVAGMIPRNRLKDHILKNLVIYVGDEK
ncbi:MAG: 50S ribosomal protein L13 [Patescibacteria group bacterium]